MGRPTIAVLGGGQLGAMLGLAGIPLGARFRFLDPTAEAPAGAVGALTVGALGDVDAARAVARGAAVVTFEWEGVPAPTASALAGSGVPVRPSASALAVAQDRLVEKRTFVDLSIPVAPFAAVDDAASLTRALDEVGLPALVKTRHGGYDGKGQWRIDDARDTTRATAELGGRLAIVEAVVAFERELSIIAVRGLDGTVSTWPLAENRHHEGILRTTRAPALSVEREIGRRADEYAGRLLEHLDYVGVRAIELFERDGALLANEFAPRVHNSGHWTIEGAETSQFENHVRAVLGWPLGPTGALGHAVMRNCIGGMPDAAGVFGVSGAHLHDYGKAARRGRKVGHVTVTGRDPEELDARTAALAAVWPEDPSS